MNLINKYVTFTLNPSPSLAWQGVRFVLHWVTLPIKLIVIGGLGGYQILKNRFKKTRSVPAMPSDALKKSYVMNILKAMPILKTEELELYCNRVPYDKNPDGWNHNSDHQCSRHSTFAFLMDKIGLRNNKIDKAVWMHMQGKWLCRGFKYNPYENNLQFNGATTSGDMLCGLNLGVLTSDDDIIRERFEILIGHILENDYSLLEGAAPEQGDPGYEEYQRQLKASGMRPEMIRMKSARGMWQPGLETVGAQALTILSALRIADKKLGSKDARRAYRKLLWVYGYGLLSLFPTAYIDSKRGYFNDHNCMIALYVLSKLSDSKLGKFFWKQAMVYVWKLSRHWYNGYFTGLLNDAHPGTVDQQYIDDCIAYLYEYTPRTWTYNSTKTITIKDVPVDFNLLEEDEFAPDVDMSKQVIDFDQNDRSKGGLGFIAHAIMLESNPRKLIE